MKIDIRGLVKRIRRIPIPAFSSWVTWAQIAFGALAMVLTIFLIRSIVTDIEHAIFGDPKVKAEHASTVVAEEQVKAEQNIATHTIELVHKHDVYHEHVTNIVHETQEKIDAADQGQQMDPGVDAAVADGLCRLNSDLCRPAAPEMQPVR